MARMLAGVVAPSLADDQRFLQFMAKAMRSSVSPGAAQAYLLRDRLANAWMWAAAVPLLWALGWAVTTAGGIDVDRQFAVFGAYGAITFMALSGVLLDRLRAATNPPTPAPVPNKAMAQ